MEKVLTRLILLNKYYPLQAEDCEPKKNKPFLTPIGQTTKPDTESLDTPVKINELPREVKIYKIVRNSFIDQDLVFFGGYAISLYSKYLPKNERSIIKQIDYFDVLSNDPEKTAKITKEKLEDNDIKNVSIIEHEEVGEIIPKHFELKVNGQSIAFIYKPLACHSYNTFKKGDNKIKVATIDTMLSLFLAMVYSGRKYFNTKNILCMAQFLFFIQSKNRLEQRGLLKRFSITCYGKQQTLDDIKMEKKRKYEELKNNQDSKEYEEWFLKYDPMEEQTPKNKEKSVKRVKSKRENRKTKKVKKILGLF